MRITLASEGNTLASNLSELFARSSFLIIIEVKDKKVVVAKVIENDKKESLDSAGVSLAHLVTKEDVDLVMVNRIGPRARKIIKDAGIDLYSRSGLIEDILKDEGFRS